MEYSGYTAIATVRKYLLYLILKLFLFLLFYFASISSHSLFSYFLFLHLLKMQRYNSFVHLLSFQLLTGTNYTVGWIPTELKEATFQTLLAHCALLKDHYEHNGHSYVLNANR